MNKKNPISKIIVSYKLEREKLNNIREGGSHRTRSSGSIAQSLHHIELLIILMMFYKKNHTYL